MESNFIFFGFTRLDRSKTSPNPSAYDVVNRLIELIRLIDKPLHEGLLSARSWRAQPVHTTTLYKPKKCQSV